MNRSILMLLALLQAAFLSGQQTQAGLPASATVRDPQIKAEQPDVPSLRNALGKGLFRGSFRTFFMATDNERMLSDYHALAAGGGLHYNTASWHGLSFGIGGTFHFKLASSDLGAKDSLTGASSRYEIGLFDIEDPKNRSDLDRIQELWLRYHWKKSQITLGRQYLQTPFINNQDGRMRPNAESGLWVETNDLAKCTVSGGWLWKISPRSTVKWYDIAESIGVYPKGLNPDGSSSGYHENLKSAGVGLLGISRKLGQGGKIQVWDQYVDHIFNTAYIQVDYLQALKKGHKLLAGLQLTRQNALADGGNADASKTYFSKGGRADALSVQSGWQKGAWQVLAAYTRIGSAGRFLMPREWGREPFYTFMPRERMEGSGDSHSVTARVVWHPEKKKWRLETACGRFYLPDVQDHALNKYAFPSYYQLNFDARYAFGGMFEGLQAQFLYVWKGRLGDTHDNEKFIINKVNMSLYNLIITYTY